MWLHVRLPARGGQGHAEQVVGGGRRGEQLAGQRESKALVGAVALDVDVHHAEVPRHGKRAEQSRADQIQRQRQRQRQRETQTHIHRQTNMLAKASPGIRTGAAVIAPVSVSIGAHQHQGVARVAVARAPHQSHRHRRPGGQERGVGG